MIRWRTLLISMLLVIPLGTGGATWLALAAPPLRELTLGTSGEGRPISALRIGDGPRKLVLVGDTHGGPEANTYALASQLAEYFRNNPGAVPPSVSLYVIPTLNPDGLALGTRFNARGVDLNRNMNTNLDACPENDWRVTVQGAYGVVSDTGGPYADSEVESRLIRDFLLDASGVIFFHSNAGNVFPAFCDHPPSTALARAYAEAAGYSYARLWPFYMITGGMHDWAASLGIAAITPELVTGDQPEFDQNLAGVREVLARADELLPPPVEREEGGITVPALIWRFWKAHGGADRFGLPLAPAHHDRSVSRQVFERAVLELHTDQADTPYLVQVAPPGREMLQESGVEMQQPGDLADPCALSPAPCHRFPETGYTLRAGFYSYWERADGMRLFGYPLSEEVQALTADGRLRTVQYFERAVFAYYPEDGSVRLEPLGWYALARERLDAAPLLHSIR
jgi:predicted deacylase